MDALDYSILGLTVERWLLLLGLWALFTAGLYFLKRVVAWRVTALAKRTTNIIDDVAAELLVKTHFLFLLALGLYFTAATIALPSRARQVISTIVFLLLLVQVVSWGNFLIADWIRRYKERKIDEDAAAVTTMYAVGFITRLLLYSIVLLLALDNFGVDITALVAGLGIGGIAVALAIQNILGDLFASLSIVLDKPFVVGDFLIVSEYLGTVEKIGLKTTRLRSLSGEQLVFSNSDLLNSRIRNYKRMFERRVVFTIGVTYQTPYETLRRISVMLREIVDAQDEVRFDRAHFKEYGDSSLVYEVVYFVLLPDYNVYMDKQQAINLEIYRRFSEENIDFAYPTRTIYVENPIEAA